MKRDARRSDAMHAGGEELHGGCAARGGGKTGIGRMSDEARSAGRVAGVVGVAEGVGVR